MIIDSERSLIGTKNGYIFLTPIENIIMTTFIERERVNILDLVYILKPYRLTTSNIQNHIYQINKKQNEFKISKVMTRIYELKIIQ